MRIRSILRIAAIAMIVAIGVAVGGGSVSLATALAIAERGDRAALVFAGALAWLGLDFLAGCAVVCDRLRGRKK